MKKYIYILFAAALMAGCDKNEGIPAENGEATPVDLIMTYATEPTTNTTYRVMCYDKENTTYVGTGTYRYDNSRPRSLVPCAVDAAGVAGADGTSNALTIYSKDNRYITIVSPAKSFKQGTFNTFELDREKEFYATSPKAWTLSGYRIIDQGENLKSLRSRVAFSFYRGANVSSAIAVGNLTLIDAGSTAEWIPNTGAITTGGTDPEIPMRAATAAEIATESSLLFVNNDAEHVFASTYGSNGVKTIKVQFKLTVGGNESTEKYILAQTLEKMKYYKFNFTVTSEQINLVLQVYDLGSNNHEWQQPDNILSGTLGEPESTLTLGTWTIGGSWVDGGGGTGTIEN